MNLEEEITYEANSSKNVIHNLVKVAKEYAKFEVIKELERMSDIMLLENEHKPIDIRIQELKSMY